MYAKYFGLKEEPFSIAPNPKYLYMSPQHKEALAHLLYGIVGDGGFVLLTGEVGTGKTTVSRCLLEQLTDQTDVAYILNPMLKATELLEAICDELDIEYSKEQMTLHGLSQCLYKFLIENHAQERNTVLIIDEAQNLTDKSLELVRLLTNLETNTKKLLKIIFVGQPELNERLAQQKFRQLSQRITARFHMHSLTLKDTDTYIQHRLKVAGLPANYSLFPQQVVKGIHKQTQGIPRLINVLCDRIMLGVYSQNKQQIDMGILHKSIQEVFGEQSTQLQANKWTEVAKKPQAIATGLALAILSGVAGWYISLPSSEPLQAVSQPQASASENKETLLSNSGELQSTTTPSSIQSSKVSGSTFEKNKPAQQPQIQKTTDSENTSDIELDKLASSLSNSVESQKALSEFYSNESINRSIPESVKFTSYNDAVISLSSLMNAVPPTELTPKNICDQIEASEWQCVQRKNRLVEDIKQFNRPAVITVSDNSGSQYSLLLIGLTQDSVILSSNSNSSSEKEIIPIQLLSEIWNGDVTLLWQPPESYRGSIKKGDNSQLVEWLIAQLAYIDGKSTVSSSTYFNDLLEARVKKFQRENGLRNDGIVGLATLLRINEIIFDVKTLENSRLAAVGS